MTGQSIASVLILSGSFLLKSADFLNPLRDENTDKLLQALSFNLPTGPDV